MKRVVLDTVVFVRGLINPHGRWGDLVIRFADRYILVSAPLLIVELLDVLRRPEVNRKFRILPGLDIERLLTLIEEAEMVEVTNIPLVSRDVKDNKFLAVAVAGKADYLVSEDQDLLVLGRYEGVQIVDALTFLRILEEGEA